MKGIGRGTVHEIQDGRWIDSDRLIFESLADAAVRLRFTWDASDPAVTLWRNEMAMGDGAWFLIEEYPMVSV